MDAKQQRAAAVPQGIYLQEAEAFAPLLILQQVAQHAVARPGGLMVEDLADGHHLRHSHAGTEQFCWRAA